MPPNKLYIFSIWEVYIKRANGEVSIIKVNGTNPDDVIWKVTFSELLSKRNDRVIRCIEVEQVYGE